MQYVRLAIAYSATSPQDVIAATEDTNARKLREMQLRAPDGEGAHQGRRSWSATSTSPPFGHGAYGIYAASQVYFDKAPKDADARARPRCWPAWSRRRRTYDPTTETGYPQALDRRNYVLEPDGRDQARSPRQEADAAKAAKLEDHRQAHPERLRRRPTINELGLLLRLLLPLVAAAGRRSARPRTTGSGS